MAASKNDITAAGLRKLEEELENRARQELIDLMSPFTEAGIERDSARTASEYVRALYGFIVKSECCDRLRRYEEMFKYYEGFHPAKLFPICSQFDQRRNAKIANRVR